jgi:hypothetical protein
MSLYLRNKNTHGRVSSYHWASQEPVSIITFWIACQIKYKLYIRNFDVEIYHLVYKLVDSEGVKWGGAPEYYWDISRNIEYIFGFLSWARLIGILVGWFDWRAGSGCLVTEMHGMPPSRSRGCVQANYQQLIPNLQFYLLHFTEVAQMT